MAQAMEFGGKRVLLCDCEGSMPLDGKALAKACAAAGAVGADAPANTHLCRAQVDRFLKAAAEDGPLLVACTQEAPLFQELAEDELGDEAAPLSFTTIRERAGWSKAADKTPPKMAALLAEAVMEPKPAPLIGLKSEGVALVYGRDEAAIEVARQLAGRLDVTVLLDRPQDVTPPRIMDIPVFQGSVAGAKGHLGAFEIVVNNYAPAIPSARGAMAFEAPKDGAVSKCDLILDLTGGTPLFPHADKRDGYFHPDPGNPALVQKALFEMADLVGDFDKPRYVRYDPQLCAYGAAGKVGCTRCLDVCPAGAISPAGDRVAYDPYICGGCGQCSAVCPTGAAT